MNVSARTLIARLNDSRTLTHGVVSAAALTALSLIEPRSLSFAQWIAYRGALAAVSVWTTWAAMRADPAESLSEKGQLAASAGVGAAALALAPVGEKWDARVSDALARRGVAKPRRVIAALNGAVAMGAWWLDRHLTQRVESRGSLEALDAAAEDAPMPAAIVVSAVVIRNEHGEVLTVRKRGTAKFMFPGGKPEPGETAAQTALREAEEELGITLDPEQLEHLGDFETAAANEPDRTVVAAVFEHPSVTGAAASGEIEELAWVAPDSTRDDLAPLLREAVFPALRER